MLLNFFKGDTEKVHKGKKAVVTVHERAPCAIKVMQTKKPYAYAVNNTFYFAFGNIFLFKNILACYV